MLFEDIKTIFSSIIELPVSDSLYQLRCKQKNLVSPDSQWIDNIQHLKQKMYTAIALSKRSNRTSERNPYHLSLTAKMYHPNPHISVYRHKSVMSIWSIRLEAPVKIPRWWPYLIMNNARSDAAVCKPRWKLRGVVCTQHTIPSIFVNTNFVLFITTTLTWASLPTNPRAVKFWC